MGTRKSGTPPTPPKTRQQPNTTLVSKSEPALAGYLLPAPIMAAICECIEAISLQDKLLKKDKEMKEKYGDCFPLCLPDTTTNVPDHIYHRIRLKDPNRAIKG